MGVSMDGWMDGWMDGCVCFILGTIGVVEVLTKYKRRCVFISIQKKNNGKLCKTPGSPMKVLVFKYHRAHSI